MNTCKCCQGETKFLGEIPFNKGIDDVSLCDAKCEPFSYFQCKHCGFLQSQVLDSWSFDKLKSVIYNDQYSAVDAGASIRIANYSSIIDGLFSAYKTHWKILDYGSGENNPLQEQLLKYGFNCQSYDPFYFNDESFGKQKFDLITLFEVIEHHTKPEELLQDINSLLADNGILFFSTEILPAEFDELGLKWWYVLPRAGHISIFSLSALQIIMQKIGLNYAYLGKGLHLAWKGQPNFTQLLTNLIQHNAFYQLGQTINFSSAFDTLLYTAGGWSDQEPWGSWSSGKHPKVSLYFDNLPEQNIKLEVDGFPFLHKKHRELNVDVYANNQLVCQWHFVYKKTLPKLSAIIPVNLIAQNSNALTIEFNIKNPTSPYALSESLDQRELGLAVKTLKLVSG